jgi:hypothetical protein
MADGGPHPLHLSNEEFISFHNYKTGFMIVYPAGAMLPARESHNAIG